MKILTHTLSTKHIISIHKKGSYESLLDVPPWSTKYVPPRILSAVKKKTRESWTVCQVSLYFWFIGSYDLTRYLGKTALDQFKVIYRKFPESDQLLLLPTSRFKFEFEMIPAGDPKNQIGVLI